MFIIKMNNNQKRILSIKFTAYYILMTLMLVSCNNNNQSEQTASSAQNADSGLDRTVLPITGPSYPADTTLDARNTKAPARFNVKAPAKAPNVIVVLIDDIGFGQSSAFGGPINMPAADKIAAAG